jgi:hypothetical protein
MSRGRMSGQQWRDKMEHSAFPKSKTMSNETIEAAEKFMAEHIPDRLDFALDPHTRSEAQKLMADFSDQQNASLTAELEAANKRVDTLKQEAQIHAQEARTANGTIAEIYQLCTGSTGEPGSWNGAAPVRELVEKLEAANKKLEAVNLAVELQKIYDDERNIQISSFWDSGWTVKFGDPTNGFTRTEYFDTAQEIAEALALVDEKEGE